MINKIEVSVIIPNYNKRKTILDCIESLLSQSIIDRCEIILIDDGSTDGSRELLQELTDWLAERAKVRVYYQRHSGPGVARNLGAEKAVGTVLVFVDSDMVFERNFLKNLTSPISSGNTTGTDSQEEYLANPDNYWARCWNIGRFASAGFRKIPRSNSVVPQKSSEGTIFRAIRAKDFKMVGGFDVDGDYTDDESIYRKSGRKATVVNARFYHRNPESFLEVMRQATWIGKSKNFTGSLGKKIINLFVFSPPASFLKGAVIGVYYNYLPFIFFKLVYDSAVWFAVLKTI